MPSPEINSIFDPDEALDLHISLIDYVEMGVVVINTDHKIVVWNDWMCRHSKFNYDDVKYRSLQEIYPDLNGKRLFQCITNAVVDLDSAVLSTALHPHPLPLFQFMGGKSHADKRLRQSISIKPFVSKDNNRYCILQILDVTVAYQREKLLRKQTKKADDAREKAEKLSTVKSEFTAMVSHELRTPLTAIHGALKLLESCEQDKLSENPAQMLDIAVRNTDRLLLLINDLLDVQKMEAGKLDYQFDQYRIADIVSQSIHSNKTYTKKYDVEFQLTDNSNNMLIRADNVRLQQVISNLISNAVKFSNENSSVEIQIDVATDKLTVSIIDHGIGIPHQFQAHVFDRFAQADGSNTRRSGGSGLGLHISREIIEAHKGRIWFKSDEGIGSTFFFELPIL